MRTGNLQPTRPNWYDRNPTPRYFTSLVENSAPHGSVQRYTYTVPANRKCIIEVSCASWQRLTVAAPSGVATAAININDGLGSSANIPIIRNNSNTAGFMDHALLALQAVLIAGHQLSANDLDISTGGLCTYIMDTKLTEYDA